LASDERDEREQGNGGDCPGQGGLSGALLGGDDWSATDGSSAAVAELRTRGKQ
jgi:hypothetical protein